MKLKHTLAAVGLIVTGCTADQVSQVIAAGQLVCLTQQGRRAVVDQNGAPVLAKDNTREYVEMACSLVNGVAVSPVGSTAPTVQITAPTVVIPLQRP